MKKEEFKDFKMKVSMHMAEMHRERCGLGGPSEAQLLEVTLTSMALNALEGIMFDLQEVKEMQDKLNAMKEETEADDEEFGA